MNKDLQQENKFLNLQLDQALKEYEELEARINKAIKYIKTKSIIKSHLKSESIISKWFLNDLLEILGDKENE